MLYGWIEIGLSNTAIFNAESNEDIILRTIYDNKIIVGNTSGTGANAGLYIQGNNVGIKKVPDPNVALDVHGFVLMNSAQVGRENAATQLTVNGNVVVKDQSQSFASNVELRVVNSNMIASISHGGISRMRFSTSNGMEINDTVNIASDIFAPAYHLTCDARTKTNVRESDACLDSDILGRLNVTDYELCTRRGRDVKGFIAQQVETIFPQAVTVSETTKMKTIDVNQIIALNTSVLKNVLSRLEALEKFVHENKS